MSCDFLILRAGNFYPFFVRKRKLCAGRQEKQDGAETRLYARGLEAFQFT